jgi:hypothetical protein
MPTMPVREIKHRLSPEDYRGLNVVAFTCRIRDRKPCLITGGTFREFESILIRELERFRRSAHVNLFMPNHGHIVLQATDPDAYTWKYMCMFKSWD